MNLNERRKVESESQMQERTRKTRTTERSQGEAKNGNDLMTLRDDMYVC